MKTFKEFISEAAIHPQSVQDRLEKYWAKTSELNFAEMADKSHQLVSSALGNQTKPDFVGTFGIKGSPSDQRDVFALDAADKKRYGQNVYRYETKTTRAGGSMPLVKIDLSKGMVYFMTDASIENDGAEFESKGTKIGWMNVFKKDKFLDNQK